MAVIPEPDPRSATILKFLGSGPAIKNGGGSIDYACGECGRVLAEQVLFDQVRHLVLFCNVCNSYNEIT